MIVFLHKETTILEAISKQAADTHYTIIAKLLFFYCLNCWIEFNLYFGRWLYVYCLACNQGNFDNNGLVEILVTLYTLNFYFNIV